MRTATTLLLILVLSLPVAAASPTTGRAATGHPRNVILLIGDGMGFDNMGVYFEWRTAVGKPLSALERIFAGGTMGMLKTNPHDFVVTDSAAAGTALACGTKTLPGILGLDWRGAPHQSILAAAEGAGKLTGLISNKSITDATPAAFYAKVTSRNYHDEIAAQLLQSGVDVALGGGARFFVPREGKVTDRYPWMTNDPDNVQGSRRDGKDLLRDGGYAVVTTARELAAVDPASTPPLLGLFSARDMSFELERRSLDSWQPSLREMTAAALARLRRGPRGYFLMVEGANIDIAAHNNDVGAMVAELDAFSDALELCLDTALGDGDTLVVVTADHQTGSPSFVYDKLWKGHAARPLPATSPLQHWKLNTDYVERDRPAMLSRQTKSFRLIFHEAAGDPDTLRTLVEEQVGVRLELDETARITALHALMASANEAARAQAPYGEQRDAAYRRELEKRLGQWGATSHTAAAWLPLVWSFINMHMYPLDFAGALLARHVAEHLNITWNTGSHTSTPVPLAAIGPGSGAFGGLRHLTFVGQRLRHVVSQ